MEQYMDDYETYKRYSNLNCKCLVCSCKHHCGASCRCDTCPDCECEHCVTGNESVCHQLR